MKKNLMRRIIKGNILQSLSQKYILVDNAIIYSQVTEIIAGFYFENTSLENSLYVWWFVLPLYIPTDIIHLTFGARLRVPSGGQIWHFGDQQFDNTVSNLIQQLQLTENSLISLILPNKFYDYYRKEKLENIRMCEAIVYTSCWLQLPSMYAEIVECLELIDNDANINSLWVKKIKDSLIVMKGKDKNVIKDQLKQNIEAAKIKLKLN